jgi:hypothetical protein
MFPDVHGECLSIVRLPVLVCRCCKCGGVNAEPLRVEILEPPGPRTASVNEPVPFEAVAYNADGKDFISGPEWMWEFGDGDKSDRNPSEHSYLKEGIYLATVTAKAAEGTRSAKATVEVIGGERTRVWQ